jgi:hypothetical protein
MLLLVALLALVLVAACGDDDDDDDGAATASPAGSPTQGGTATPGTTASPEPTEDGLPPFEDSRTVVENDAHEPAGIPVLVDVRIGTHEGYDRIAFEFEGDELPPYEVKYVAQPTDCGSGKEVLVGGTAALQVNLLIAQAHDDEGNLTIPSTDIAAGYPAIVQALSSCDFEALVTCVAGTEGDRPFRVFELSGPTRLVIDVQHPDD